MADVAAPVAPGGADPPAPATLLACNGQAGQPNPAYNHILQLSGAAIGGLVGELTEGPIGAVLGAIIGSQSYDLLNICQAPQPPPITITETDIINAVNFKNLPLQIPAEAKCIQWFVNAMWPTWCLCQDSSTPAPSNPTPVPPASGNPGLPSGPLPDACANGRSYDALSFPGGNEFVTFYPMTNTTGPHLPKGATSVRTQLTFHPYGGTDTAVSVDFNVSENGVESVYKTLTFPSLKAQPTMDFSHPVDQATTATTFTIRPATTTVQPTFFSSTQAYCGPADGSLPGQPCCQPDPYLDQRLTMIQSMLSAVLTDVGQLVGHATWIDGTRHANVSGSGSFPLVDAAVAIRAEVTTPPSSPQVLPGDPDFYWNMGFITPTAMDTPLRGNRLVFLKQSFQLPPVTDGVSYTLLEGTVVDLVEQLPGPLG